MGGQGSRSARRLTTHPPRTSTETDGISGCSSVRWHWLVGGESRGKKKAGRRQVGGTLPPPGPSTEGSHKAGGGDHRSASLPNRFLGSTVMLRPCQTKWHFATVVVLPMWIRQGIESMQCCRPSVLLRAVVCCSGVQSSVAFCCKAAIPDLAVARGERPRSCFAEVEVEGRLRGCRGGRSARDASGARRRSGSAPCARTSVDSARRRPASRTVRRGRGTAGRARRSPRAR